jgi:hypothetical protein
VYVRFSSSAAWSVVSEQALFGVGNNQINTLAWLIPAYAQFNLLRESANGSGGQGTATTYDPAVHGWLSIRHDSSDGNLHFEYAPASEDPPITWTEYTFSGPTFDITNAVVWFGGGIVSTEASPVTLYFDGFNGSTGAATPKSFPVCNPRMPAALLAS